VNIPPHFTNVFRPSSVQADFGFSFGALGAKSAKQSSLPPQRSSRRTPVQSTPRGANGSARRHRSASVQRSGSSKRTGTPKDHTITPQLGKRKRGSPNAQPGAEVDEEDELSPDREELVRSVEKSRRVVGTISPIREELDNAPDELSMLEEGVSTARKPVVNAAAVTNGTPLSVLAQKRLSSGSVRQKTPIADRIGNLSVTSRQSISRRSRSIGAEATTPSMAANHRPRLSSASHFENFNTPGIAAAEEDSEDELSPPKISEITPRVVTKTISPSADVQQEETMEEDELSALLQPSPAQNATPIVEGSARKHDSREAISETPAAAPRAAARGRPRRVVEEDEDEDDTTTAAPAKPSKRGRPSKQVESRPSEPHATPVLRKPGKRGKKSALLEDEAVEELDELSPDTERTTQQSLKPSRAAKHVVELSDGEDSDAYEEPEEEEEVREPTPRPTAKPQSQPQKQVSKDNSSPKKPARKRQKLSGIKQAISVMRIKGSVVRGITVADTARTILEDNIDHRLTRMAEKLQSSQNSANRKELRGIINLTLSFKESLNEKLLDLQDANDVLSTNFRKMKLFKRDNAELRKEILTLQNNRQEVALEHDDVQGQHDAEKAHAEARNTLNANMFDIEAAIQNGRKKAREEGREEEGPEIPLAMLLDNVGRNVGSHGGGLLGNVKMFNSALERAAGWLEGRA
jgi:hypothetical protein